MSQPPPPPPPPKSVFIRHHKLLIPTVAAAVAAGALSILAAFFISLFFYRRFRCNRTAPSSPSPNPNLNRNLNLRRFSYSQLRRATSAFSPSLKLGRGGFGSVYAGSLSSNEEIAVKLMESSGSLQGEREFQNEISLAEKISDRRFVVVPIGFCIDERRKKWWRRWWKKKKQIVEDEEAVIGKRILLVYELMHNGSLQDALLGRKCIELLDWGRRFSIAVDIAKGLLFLHQGCEPPIVHGDIKPSNILLDSRFIAKIADFGLARIRVGGQLDEEEAVVVDIDQRSPRNVQKEDDDASVMGETLAESTTTTGLHEFEMGFGRSVCEGDKISSPVVALEVASTSEVTGCDRMSVESGKENEASSSRWGFRKKGSSVGKDSWWWRQDNNGGGNADSGGGVEDYVMEWIRSEIKKERPKSDWITATAVSSEDCLPKTLGRSERKKHQRRLEWWASLDEERLKRDKKSRPAREWWREEFCEELTKKQERKRMITKCKSSVGAGEKQHWWQENDDSELPSKKRRRRRRKSLDWGADGLSGEMKRTMTERRRSQDWASSTEIPKSSCTISSTPSMRGTVCYVAPEYGGGGPLSEKCDIYSFGVLLLVLISGRRPLQVTASPMSEFERANLISWARHLAHLGRLLELVDPTLKAVDKEQALLCITVALLCIQRSPARRPSIKEIVGMLTGESEPPHLPIEFSPSPPGGFSFKSRRKAR